MKNIINARPPLIPILPRRSDMKPHLNFSKSLWFSKKSFGIDQGFSSGYIQMHGRNNRAVYSVPTCVNSSAALILAATAAPKSADISLLLLTSGVMLFVYWIANFVLPDLIMKDIQTDKTNEDGKDDGESSSDGIRGNSQVQRVKNSAQERGALGAPKRH